MGVSDPFVTPPHVVIGEALVCKYGINEGLIHAFEYCCEEVALWISEKFVKQPDWCMISRYDSLSEAFMRFFEDKVSWRDIFASQRLSEDFIREFKNRVNWKEIFKFQKLSEAFSDEAAFISFDPLTYTTIPVYSELIEEFKEEIKDKMEWGACGNDKDIM